MTSMDLKEVKAKTTARGPIQSKAEKLSLRVAREKMAKAMMKEGLWRIMLQVLELGFLSSRRSSCSSLSWHQVSNQCRPCNKV